MLAFCDGFFSCTFFNTYYIHVLYIEWKVLRRIKNGLNKYIASLKALLLLLLFLLQEQHVVFLFIPKNTENSLHAHKLTYTGPIFQFHDCIRDFRGLHSHKIPRANRLINIVPLSFRCYCYFFCIFPLYSTMSTQFYNKILTVSYWSTVTVVYISLYINFVDMDSGGFQCINFLYSFYFSPHVK